MSGHDHHHEDDCHCHECEEKKTEKTSMEEAGGVAIGLVGHIHGYNADVEARFAKALLRTGKWVEKESGSLLGHIKAAIYKEDGRGITLNLTDIDNGVEHHGTLEPCERVDFNFMSAVLDVDPHELEHVMIDSLDDNGIDYHLNNPHHHHEHEECGCGHDDHHHHEHGHHHDHDSHHHEHGHHHGEHKHHHKEDDGTCHCKACEERRAEAHDEPEKVSLISRLRRKKK
jgi:ABC-type Zn2+ transport system, periplasmic component/surface adhesin